MNQDAYVIVPVYNESSVISNVLNDLKNYFTKIVCVDDGSTDDSADIIKSRQISLLKHRKNKGQGAALRTGLRHVLRDQKAQYFVTFDSDGQHRAVDAARMLNFARKSQFDVVLGSRFLGSTENIPRSRRGLLKAAVLFTNVTTGLRLSDAHNGLRVFNRSFAASDPITLAGMAHASELFYHIKRGHFTYAEYPVRIRYTDYSRAKGQSTFGAVTILKDLVLQRF